MTPPTTPTPSCDVCGPFFRVRSDGSTGYITWSTTEIQRLNDPAERFHCQRCGTVHVLHGGKLEREENKTMIESNIWPKPPQTESEVKTCATIPPYSQAIHSTVNAMSVPVASPAPVQSKPEFGATPVRYNVTRYGEMHNEPDGQWVRFEDYASERAAREAAEKETQNISERLHEILERTGNTRNERDAAFAERDQLRSQLAEHKRQAWVNVELSNQLGKARTERDAALARVEELEEERKVLKGAISNANWLLSDHVDAGGGVKSLEQWSQAIAQDRKARYSALRADSVPRKLVEELQKFARHTEACINDPGFHCSCGLVKVRAALADMTKGEKE